MGSLNQWVSDKLIDILGYSEKTIVDFVVAIAKKSKDTPTLLESLEKCGVPNTAKTQSFAAEILNKVPRTQQGAAISQSKLQEKKAIETRLKNESYKLINMDDD